MILIFDTGGGLCNQIRDIESAIHFCIYYKIKFTFRYASFRDKNNLFNFYYVPFKDLFNSKYYETITDLYIDYDNIRKIKPEKTGIFSFTYNQDTWKNDTYNKSMNKYEFSKRHIGMCKDYINVIITQLYQMNKKFIMMGSAFWTLYDSNINILSLPLDIKPSQIILQRFDKIITKNKLINNNFNFLHYRYEPDMKNLVVNDYKLEFICPSIKELINQIPYKNKKLPLYLASSNVENLVKDINNNLIVYKKNKYINDLNFEQCAFIDLLIGKMAVEIYGFSHSSFSMFLNKFKGTTNYYN